MNSAEIGKFMLEGTPLLCAITVTTLTFALFMKAMLGEKRSILWMILYDLIMIYVRQAIFQRAVVHFYSDSPEAKLLYAMFCYVMALFTYFVMCFVFQGDFLKVGIAGVIADGSSSIMVSFSMGVVNFFSKRELTTLFEGLYWEWLLVALVGFCMLFVTYRLAAPFLKKFRGVKLKFRGLLWVALAGYIILATGSLFVDAIEGSMVRMAWMLTSSVPVLLGIVFCSRYQAAAEQEHAYLELQQRLTELHYDAVRNQIRRIQDSQELINEQMQEIVRMEELAKAQTAAEQTQRIKAYLQTLRKEYDQINAGIYCDDWLVDSALFSQGEKLKQQGIEFEFLLQGFDRGKVLAQDMVKLLLLLLDWGAEQCRGVDGGKLSLRAVSVRNQIMIECTVPAYRAEKISRRGVGRLLKKYNGTIQQQMGENENRLLLSLDRN